jgi:transposase-like protein
MSPRKLTAADKKEIVKVYRSSAENTAALATRYGVSNSTVSRLLKSHIPEVEYETLMSEKRGQKAEFSEEEIALLLDPSLGSKEVVAEVGAIEDLPELELDPSVDRSDEPVPISSKSKPIKKGTLSDQRRVRRRSSALSTNEESELTADASPELPIKPIIKAVKSLATPTPETVETSVPLVAVIEAARLAVPVQTILPLNEVIEEDEDDQEDVLALADILGEDMGGLLDEDEEEFNDEEDWSDGLTPSVLASDIQVKVLPLSAANLPRTCYIVIDKFAELIAKPLQEFAELGNIPTDEVPQQTLPIFDNHRVAKRFSSSHTNRVIKVPDSSLFQKTSRHLEAKGITRLLIDGRIYSLH